MKFWVKRYLGDGMLEQAEVFLISHAIKFILAEVNKQGVVLLHDYLLKHYKG